MLPVPLAESAVLMCSQATEATAGDFLCAQEVKNENYSSMLLLPHCLLQAASCISAVCDKPCGLGDAMHLTQTAEPTC